MIWKKKVKRTDAHCKVFDLGSDWDFSNIDSVLILASGARQKKFDYKKVKTTFGPPLLPIKPPHWNPPLTNLRGFQTVPLLPMLEKEARAQFYRDKICGGMLQGTEYCERFQQLWSTV